MATTIRILPENLTNKIAAGEVVERPASVAKELVENALDAGSREVTVEIESGGKKLIKVTDTGSGMSREDALLAMERHATSKIATDEDLFAIATLGFRGEALPSIASVCRFSICTRRGDAIEGTEIYAEGGRIKEVKECGMAAGTVISVRNLFFNTPARLKFMKSPETEGGHVGELLTRLAISRPDVRFTYVSDGKTVFRVLDTDLKERVSTLLGRPLAASLYPVERADASGLRIRGLVAAPECSRSAATYLYTYINGRFIRDKVVQHAIMQGYRNFLERGRYPVLALFIEIPPGEVDVNVHPTKHEVRFREQGRVHDAIQAAVESVLSATPWLKNERRSVLSVPPPAAPPAQPRRVETAVPGDCGPSAARVAEVRELLVSYTPRPQSSAPPSSPFVRPVQGPAAAGGPASAPENAASCTPAPVMESAAGGAGLAGAGGVAEEPEVFVPTVPKPAPEPDSRGYFSELSVIGQYNAAYIVCQSGTDLVLVDQHAAHERVAFERLKGEFATKKVGTQGLLFPETLELSFREAAALAENVEELERLGFDLEEFGGNTWILKGVPQILAGGEYLRTVRDILEELASLGRSRSFSDIQEEILAKVACHGVVRGRSVLSQQEIVALFSQMDRTDFSSNCPHGRPVMQKLTLAEVEKMFKRQ